MAAAVFAQEILLPFDNSDIRIIAPDRPGYGLSTPAAPAERGPEGQSFWLERLLTSLDLSEVRIVAHSIGSAAALHLAARRPDLVRGLFLISPCCAPVPSKPLIVLRSAVAPVDRPLIRQHVIGRWPTFFLSRSKSDVVLFFPIPFLLISRICRRLMWSIPLPSARWRTSCAPQPRHGAPSGSAWRSSPARSVRDGGLRDFTELAY
ncbi:alpha/beta fold hydrolase [Rhizobium leguminosarum]